MRQPNRHRGTCVVLALLLLLLLVPSFPVHAESALISTRDTLDVQLDDPVHRDLLGAVVWTPQPFHVVVETAQAEESDADAIVTFPSPLPQHARNANAAAAAMDTAVLEWYQARDAAGQAVAAPAVVVVPETNRRRVAAKMLARAIRERGVHAFVLQPPGYGRRRGPSDRDVRQLVSRTRQAVADTRRARDAVAALPLLQGQRVFLAGVSLGGFVVTLAAELDHAAFDGLFVLLAGGDLYTIVTTGDRDARKFRQQLEAAGYRDETLRGLLDQIEPLRGADRLDPARTWIYSCTQDTVVPPAATLRLVESAKVPADHHLQFPFGHYTAVFIIPAVVEHMSRQVLQPVPVP